MLFKAIPLLLLIVCVGVNAWAQQPPLPKSPCTTLGQTPASAFPICATSVFKQDTVPQCYNAGVPAPGCGSYPDVNPYWYKFTCYKTGTLNILITPVDLGDDYDWQLFDVTNAARIDDIYTNPRYFVVANWSGTYGKTGTMPGNLNVIECASDPADGQTTYSQQPILQAGHNYLLLISHYTRTITGYSLSLLGGSAVIVDTTKPALKNSISNCGGTKIGISLTKSVKCGSLSRNGSDFSISTNAAKIISAEGANCSNSFDMDSLILTLDKPLPPGTYQVSSKIGDDDNTLLDNCDNWLPENQKIDVTVYAVAPTPFDSMVPIACAPKTLQFVFRKRIFCNSIADNGSDFLVNGPYPVKVVQASGICDTAGLTYVVNVTLSAPINRGGTYIVKIVKGNDGNTIVDECSQQTPTGEEISFVASDTVAASFTPLLKFGCRQDTVILSHDGSNNVITWKWVFDDSVSYNTQNLTRLYNGYGDKEVTLTVSNGVCTDERTKGFALDNELKARFSSPPLICPEDKAIFKDTSIGKIITWNWLFSNGNNSAQQDPPPQTYPSVPRDKYYPIRLIVQNGGPCYDTSFAELKVLYNCYIAVPTAFTPNGDNINDYLYPLNAYKATNLEFKVYNRWGQLVFETKDWMHKWDGTLHGVPQASGVYAWYLIYTHLDTKQKYTMKGTTVLIR